MTRMVFGPEEGFDEEMLEIRHAVPPTQMLGLSLIHISILNILFQP